MFVLQRDNFNDQEQFLKLAQHYKFNATIARLEDWGTWKDFSEHDVIGNTNHPDHCAAISELFRVYNLYSHLLKNPGEDDDHFVIYTPSLRALCQTQ